MSKTLLFVTYGGGHARMIVPVVKALEGKKDLRIVTMALTSAGQIFTNAGIAYVGYKDLLTADDAKAIACGEKLAATYHRAESGIAEDEAIAYIGLSYWDLVQRHGETQAQRLLEEHGRQAFYPLSIMERAMDTFMPDMVVTTNSPRSEQAAIAVAKKRGIPTMSIIDLLGAYTNNPLEADYITVLSEPVIKNIQKHKGIREGQTFLVTGNPAFDSIFDERGPIDYAWRRKYFPDMPERAKALLWIDAMGYDNPQDFSTHLFSPEEIVQTLEQLAAATEYADAYLLIRPHPSQSKKIFDDWMQKTTHKHVLFAHDLPLHPLLRAIDAVAIYYSTVGCEAVLMQRPVLQLNYYNGNALLPLGDWGLARLVQQPQDLPNALSETLNDKHIMENLLMRANKLFPQEKASPKIAEHIIRILSL